MNDITKQSLLFSLAARGLLASGVGAVNAALSPKGHRMEGFGRGVAHGTTVPIGFDVGGVVGGLGSLKLLQDAGAGAGAQIAGGLTGGIGGAGLGSYGAYKATNAALGRPSWEKEEEKKGKPTAKEAAESLISLL